MHQPCTAAITGLDTFAPMLGTPSHISLGGFLTSAPTEKAFSPAEQRIATRSSPFLVQSVESVSSVNPYCCYFLIGFVANDFVSLDGHELLLPHNRLPGFKVLNIEIGIHLFRFSQGRIGSASIVVSGQNERFFWRL